MLTCSDVLRLSLIRFAQVKRKFAGRRSASASTDRRRSGGPQHGRNLTRSGPYATVSVALRRDFLNVAVAWPKSSK
jgi:hypothetical protein